MRAVIGGFSAVVRAIDRGFDTGDFGAVDLAKRGETWRATGQAQSPVGRNLRQAVARVAANYRLLRGNAR